MNTKLKAFVEHMKGLTGECWIYSIEHWGYSHCDSVTKYILRSNMDGFSPIEKESEEDLLDVLDLIRAQVDRLMEAKDLNRLANQKLLKGKI